ncbi:hypothetical protein [Burkholderia territorii]|uniref:hypothetical protein n=1 Tax=Burkholderia territorii TaxID=1503055 RepID=UPI000753717C|nr:hypothetical protein [Burkholderia territorii]KVQ63373.1 hypothetical protein WT22_11515 [Burkholderia territorii]KVQ65331.1 hypothetical protein WT23_15035 [Burkholderia territorii]KWA24095.1 hypothetical protein WT38_09320 [Burkholderia territorii]KWA30428.1 hypothetical protein WT40_23750 [Burkholderia territorii]KWA39004.1 hypothetical protein WT41_19545 [Burkholderia territorii]
MIAASRRAGHWIGAALRTLLRARVQLAARTTAAADAPAAWIAYADGVARRLQTAIDGDDAAACRLRADVGRWADRLADTGDDRLMLPVRAWLDRRGHVTRVDSAPAADPAVDAALRDALVGRAIGTAPPHGMTQPIVLRMALSRLR